MKKKTSFSLTAMMDWLKSYWVQVGVIIAAIGAAFVFPFRLNAMESRQDKFEEVQQSLYDQTTMIGKWVEQEQQAKEFEKERVASAPPGWRWDSSKREYVKK